MKIDRCPKPEREHKSEGADLPDDIAQLSMQETPASSAAAGASPRRIEVLAGNARGAPNVTSLEIIRAEDQGFKELDEIYVMMHLAKAQQLIYGKSPPKVTSIILRSRCWTSGP